MNIRKAEAKDKDDVQKLIHHLGHEIQNQDKFDNIWALTNILVFEEHSKVVGYLSYSIRPQLRLEGYSMEIDELSVSPAHTGKGIGARLVEHVKHLARKEGVKRIIISTNKERESFHRNFYLKQGFELKNSALFKMDL